MGEVVDAPEKKIWMGHEVCDSFKHTPWFENECREGYAGKIHADSVCRRSRRFEIVSAHV